MNGTTEKARRRGVALILALMACTGLWGPAARAAETTTYVLTDVQGTVLAREDAHGNIIARYDYRPYGKQQTGPVAAGPGYTGHVEDPDTGLVYMQQRYYDPVVGRFLSVDPIRAGGQHFNRYWYANNNPIKNMDPYGLYTCDRSTKKGREFCKKIDKYVDYLHKARSGYRPGSRGYRAVSIIMNYVGSKGGEGPNYVPGTLKFNATAKTNQHGTTTIDLSKQKTGAMVASEMGHEAQHDLDVRDHNGPFGDTGDPVAAEREFRFAEERGYKAQSLILGGFGKTLTSNELRRGIEGSVKHDMTSWYSRHEKQGPGDAEK